jgi:UDP:flavonoid glycosyltransferase YjiC (YdhE family)
LKLRIFLGAFGQPGHAFPMLALGARLAQRGHYVTFETWERWRPYVLQAGMEFVAAPEYQVFPTGAHPLKPYAAVVSATGPTRKVLVAHAPHVVVHDILTLAPALAAELEGVPRATLVPHLYPVTARGFPPYSIGARLPRTPVGTAIWSGLDRLIMGGLRQGQMELNETRRRVGLPPLERFHGGISEQLCLVCTFPQLEYPRPWLDTVKVVGPLLWEPPAPEPTPLPPGDAPLVVVAPSTSHDPELRLVEAAVEGLAATGARVLAATGDRPARRTLRAGPSTRLVSWVSYEQVMAEAALVVCHGGHGTVARALTHGVPLVVVPHSGDMAENAARVEWAGVGVRLPWRLLNATTLQLAAWRVLSGTRTHAAAAATLAAWARANDAAEHAAELVEQLGAVGMRTRAALAT